MLSKENSTIKTYVDRTRGEIKETVFSFDEYLQSAQQASTFTHMPYILAQKQVSEGEIFLIDGDVVALQGLIRLIKETDTEDVKIGVLFRVNGHTTPFVIEKIFDESTEQDTVCVYHTDSVVMDIDVIDDIKAVVRAIAEDTLIYSLGIHDPQGVILRDYKRQFDASSCATYALYDIEQILMMDFYAFVRQNSDLITGNLYNLTSLPHALMAAIQSVNGRQEAGMQLRNGLQYYVDCDPERANHPIVVNGESTTLTRLLQEIRQERISNPIIDIMNSNNLALYDMGLSRFDESSVRKHKLTAEDIEKNRTKYADLIFDIATRQFDAQSDELSIAAEETKSPQETQETKAKGSSRKAVATMAIATVIAGVIVLLLEMQKDRHRETPSFRFRRRVVQPQQETSQENIMDAIRAREQQLSRVSYRRATPEDFGLAPEAEDSAERSMRVVFK